MKVLVIGSGGREHTLVWKIAQSPRVRQVFCAPGNPGIARSAECIALPVKPPFSELVEFARREQIALTVVGPEDPLAEGIVDAFEQAGLRIFGPNRLAAQMEASKKFAKAVMLEGRVPQASYAEFTSLEPARRYIAHCPVPFVIKFNDLAKGKGVSIHSDRTEAEAKLADIFERRVFGDPSNGVVIEEFLEGEEASVLAFVDGRVVLPMEAAQDHKAIFDGDRGPNTGGMGAYCPAPVVDAAMAERVRREILEPTVAALARRGIIYKGVLYAGLMIGKDGPKVLEFNCRFGDPEVQAVLPRLENDVVDVMDAAVDGRLSAMELRWSRQHAICVVAASAGYPGDYAKGKTINGLDEAEKEALVFHAGTARKDGQIVTNGGRVLGVTALGDTLAEAQKKAYAALEKIHFEGIYYRRDIGYRALKREK
ncbi:MAG: phosphoribosylamine--glycine ligase [Candidatus Sumerlaeia bacterium]|nr:phosphoribosylamine--glycine ligase [Candidatus Sumerlaeia bacterium]